MKRSVKIATLLIVLVLAFGNSITAFASLGVDNNGKETLYVMNVSEVGSFDGNGQAIDICNGTNSSLDVYINDSKEYTLAANGAAGSVLSYKTKKYSYVFSYTADSGRLDIYVGMKGANGLGNTSKSTTSQALAASAQAQAKGDQKTADELQAKAEESMSTYMQNMSDYEANRVKTDDAYVDSSASSSSAMSSKELAEKYEAACDDLDSSIK